MTIEYRQYFEKLIQNFVNCEDTLVSFDDLNEFAAHLTSEDGRWMLFKLIEISRVEQLSIWKRELLCISVFELCVEDPVWPLWLEVLPHVLESPEIWWIIIRSYRDAPEALVSHMRTIDVQTDPK